jgi:hypothetical protein
MWVGAFVGPVMIRGMTDASATQPCKAMDAKLWVDHREFIHPHFACANGMSEARRSKSGKLSDVVGSRLGTGHEFGLAHTVEGMLISKFTRGFDGAHDGRKIVIRAEKVAIDHGGILKVVARQTYAASARWLHKSRRDRECVRRRLTKARGRFGCNSRQLFEDKIDVGITGRD